MTSHSGVKHCISPEPYIGLSVTIVFHVDDPSGTNISLAGYAVIESSPWRNRDSRSLVEP